MLEQTFHYVLRHVQHLELRDVHDFNVIFQLGHVFISLVYVFTMFTSYQITKWCIISVHTIHVRTDSSTSISESKKHIHKSRKSLKTARGTSSYPKAFTSRFLYVIEFSYSAIEFENLMKYFVCTLI